MKRLTLAAGALLLVAVAGIVMLATRSTGSPQAPLPTLALTLNTHTVRAELAQTPEQTARGLMFRATLAPDAGMLFVYPRDFEGRACMWMKNTIVPLSVAFLDRSGRVLNIADMQPHSQTQHCARGPARYALELNQGAFAAASVVPGSVVGGLPP